MAETCEPVPHWGLEAKNAATARSPMIDRPRRHPQHRVLAQQLDERRRRRRAPRRRRSAQQLALRRRGGRWATRRGERSASIAARARCSALLTAATVESSSSATSARRPAEHVAQDQDRPLAAGQPLDRGQERELDALAAARSGPRGRRPASPALGEPLVRDTGTTGSGRRGRRSSSSRQALVAIRYSQVSIDERPSKRSSAAPGAQQRLLDDVLGVLGRAEHPVAVHLERPPVRLDQLAERPLVARLREREHALAVVGRGAAGQGVACGHRTVRRSPARKLIGEFCDRPRLRRPNTGMRTQ